jgi:GAF domain-containing protein
VTRSGDGSELDLTSAMRAVNAIASEIRLAPLVRRLMHILVENAGATLGVLLLAEGGGLKVRASLRVDPEELFTELDEALDTSGSRVASSIVYYCLRTREPLVIDDAARDNRFAADPFVMAQASKSIVCLPLIHQGETVGILYLENDVATGAFHASRVERLGFLGGHAAVSLQNARLYAQRRSSPSATATCGECSTTWPRACSRSIWTAGSPRSVRVSSKHGWAP